MSDRFRELESPLLARTKDVVLMATVSSYQGMTHPTRNELKQFAELFEPIFKASSQEARRNAVAALSRCETVPAGVAWFLATQPIELAAIFLTSSPALDNDLLIAVARSQGAAHAKAIAARENLSVKVVDALVAQHQMLPSRARTVASPTATGAGETTAAREDILRQTLKSLVARDSMAAATNTVDADAEREEALLIRFARLKEAHGFSRMLAHCLGASIWLSNRIMLDLSGLQLATALKALDINQAESSFVLRQFYPHLAAKVDDRNRADDLLAGLDDNECVDRIASWIRADNYTQGKAEEPVANVNATQAEDAGPRVFGRRINRA